MTKQIYYIRPTKFPCWAYHPVQIIEEQPGDPFVLCFDLATRREVKLNKETEIFIPVQRRDKK